jgi:membrane-associated protease RseP (regulator of RpoE activity)
MSDPTSPSSYTFEVPAYPRVLSEVSAPQRRYWLHALLLLLTIFTTLVVGARLQFNFVHDLPAFAAANSSLPLFPIRWILQHPARLAMGIPFSLTLLGILLAHEFGHFLLAEHHGVYATLPYFVPAPTLIGTFGAVIRIKSPIRSRKALFDIGIAGPIAGFLVAIPVLLWGLALSKPMPYGQWNSSREFGYPLIFRIFHHWLAAISHSNAPLSALYLHPVGIAAWVGMFATALNLMPGGQFDGGHIIYAVAPRAHKWVTRTTVLILVFLGIYWPAWGTWTWPGWLVWGVILAFTGMRHPNVPKWPGIGPERRWLALVAVLMLLLTLVLAPFQGATLFGS